MKPPSRLEECVECFWISETAGSETRRVLPDGCADVIYTRSQGETALRFVGPMTRYQNVAVPSGTIFIGVRFRPAMWTGIVHLRGEDAPDETIALEDLWGKRSADLLRRLDSTDDSGCVAAILAEAIPAPDGISEVQRAVQFLERNNGQVSAGKLSEAAGLSERQFRRRCVEHTSLSPKLLSRILRFRKARAMLSAGNRGTDVAVACGYFDQSHMIAEFKNFSGRTPILGTIARRQRGRIAREQGCRSDEDRHQAVLHDEPCD